MKINRVDQLIHNHCLYLSWWIGALLDYVICCSRCLSLFTCLVDRVVKERYTSCN